MPSLQYQYNPNLRNWIENIISRTEIALDRALPSTLCVPQRLHEAMRYAVLGVGKRIRPLLCHATGSIFSAKVEALDASAVATEMIHAYSLVHDDMPEMDNAEMRRGKPSVHIAYDKATALLVGDALQSLAFEVIASCPLSAEKKVISILELSQASGSFGMAGGQFIDLMSVGLKSDQLILEKMYFMKTGTLLRAAVRLGTFCAQDPIETSEVIALNNYAEALGLAFQIVDDILDITADSLILGKTAGKDVENQKPTYVSLLGLENARAIVRALETDAKRSLKTFGIRAWQLRELVDFLVQPAY